MTQEQTIVTLVMGREEMEWLNFINGRSLGEDPQTPAPEVCKGHRVQKHFHEDCG